ncbi:MAG: hypothetical protein KF765_12335 [Parvibaculaceae bacterium]|nr:hypothetical protein [Parvibaculaceae bacterium]
MSMAPLKHPGFTHVAVYRDVEGEIVRRVLFFTPLATDEEALAAGSAAKRAGEAFCDVFEFDRAERLGGWQFKVEGSFA